MKKILIIDDEEAILAMYKAALETDFSVFLAKNGLEGIEIAKKEKPDLIYLDIIMPKMNGLDVLKQFKEDKELAEIPIVLLTNLPKEASAEKAISLGAKDYFVKVEKTPEQLAEISRALVK